MIEDGLFEKFPCDVVFAIHNKPGVPLGHIVSRPGPLLAAADRWTSASPAAAAMPPIRTPRSIRWWPAPAS